MVPKIRVRLLYQYLYSSFANFHYTDFSITSFSLVEELSFMQIQFLSHPRLSPLLYEPFFTIMDKNTFFGRGQFDSF